MSQSADTADANADADEDVEVVLDSLCFSRPPTIVIEQCKLNLIVSGLILKKNEELCVVYCSGYYKARRASWRASGKIYEAQIVIFCILLAVNRFSWISRKVESR
jgi:hypothetical protein